MAGRVERRLRPVATPGYWRRHVHKESVRNTGSPMAWSLGDGFRISEVILLSLRIGAHVFRRHQAGVVAKHLELATEMMRADAGLHTDQARRQVGEPRFHLAA